jgi:hypothetical protein
MESKGKKLSEIVEDLVWVSSNPSIKRPSPSSIYISFGDEKNPRITTMNRLPILNFEAFEVEQKHYFYLYYRKKQEGELKKIGVDPKEVKQIIREAFVAFMSERAKENWR